MRAPQDPRRRAALALAAIVASVAATLAAWHRRPPPLPPPAASNVPLFPFPPREVVSLEVEAARGRIRARREADGWRVEGLDADEAAREAVAALVAEVVGLPVIDRFPREGRSATEYGLADPRIAIELGLADGARRRLEVGAANVAGSALYVRAVPPDDVALVGSLLLGTIDAAFYRLRGPAPAARIETVAPVERSEEAQR